MARTTRTQEFLQEACRALSAAMNTCQQGSAEEAAITELYIAVAQFTIDAPPSPFTEERALEKLHDLVSSAR